MFVHSCTSTSRWPTTHTLAHPRQQRNHLLAHMLRIVHPIARNTAHQIRCRTSQAERKRRHCRRRRRRHRRQKHCQRSAYKIAIVKRRRPEGRRIKFSCGPGVRLPVRAAADGQHLKTAHKHSVGREKTRKRLHSRHTLISHCNCPLICSTSQNINTAINCRRPF